MKLIKPEVIDITQTDYSLKGIYKQIELAGRTCYKSEDRITEDSAEPFVKMLIDRGHTAMLEHGTVYLTIPMTTRYSDEPNIYQDNKYSIVKESTGFPFKDIYGDKCDAWCVTTNYRVIVENNINPDPEFLCGFTEWHERRVSFRIICSIGIARELCRHRVFSFAQESTRYCNYGKEKFGEMSFIEPYWYKDADFISQDLFKSNLEIASVSYRAMINNKMMAQQAREVLPLATKTELVMTGTVSQWKAFLKLRLDKAAHPDMRIIAQQIKEKLSKYE